MNNDIAYKIVEELHRLADVLGRAYPLHGWDYKRVGWLLEDDKPPGQGGETRESLNEGTAVRWEVFSEPQTPFVGYLLRRPRQASEDEGRTGAEIAAIIRGEANAATAAYLASEGDDYLAAFADGVKSVRNAALFAYRETPENGEND